MITPHSTASIPEDMVNEIQIEMPEAPYDLVVQQLQQACREFCEKSNYWIENAVELTIVADQETYNLTISNAGKEIVGVNKVYDQDENVYEKCATKEVYRGWWQSTPETVDVYAGEDITGYVVQIEVSIKPKLNAGAFLVSAPLLSNYREALLAGTKSKLYKIPRKPWTDFNLSKYNEAIFIAESDSARANQARGFSRFPTDTRTPDKKRSFY
jgi:hypothetical protein